MAKYRKKPIVVEAVQWTGHNFQEVENLLKGTVSGFNCSTLPAGEWILRGLDNDVYTLPNHIFVQTYDVMQSKDPLSTVLNIKQNVKVNDGTIPPNNG